ncbi:MAG TPA: tail fiber protein [Pyrinomonadaceae bacterium]|nr:tail fiber protein [Pyrinomonadaceae bacterium]
MSEIKIVAFNYAPRGWAMCNGQLLPIAQNQALFALLGTTYGGNGQTNFALPDLRGRIPLHFGDGFTLGEKAGEQAHTVSISELPGHTHFVTGSNRVPVVDDPNSVADPTGAWFGRSSFGAYHSPASLTTMHPAILTNTGGSQPHNNMAPYLVLTFVIALTGIFPSQN